MKEMKMALPKQVQRDLDELEEYERSLTPAPDADATAAEPDTYKTDPQPQKPTPAAEAPPTAEPSAVVAEPKQPNEWEHKYRTLEGKYQAEVPRLHQQNKEMATHLQTLQAEIDALKQPKPEPAPPAELVSAKDVEEYGEDLINMQRRVAAEAVAPFKMELAKRDEEIAQLRQALNKTGGDVATMSFEQRLAMEVPDFGKINADPKWIAWLDETDVFTGEPRRAFAEFVYNNGDVAKVKRVVENFKATVGETKASPNQGNQAELERQITPTRANIVASTAPTASDRIYTEAQMVAAFNKVRTLNVAGKHDEASKLEAELSNAYMQGRVRG